MTEYTLTLSYWVCTEWVRQCQTACGDHANNCIASCAQDHPCGATNPVRINATKTTTSSSASATSTQIFNGPDGVADDSGAAPMAMLPRFGMGVVVAGLAVGFGMLV